MDQLYNDILGENKYGYLSVGSYEHYKLYRKTAEKPISDRTLYTKIIKSIFAKIWQYMIKDNWTFNAPEDFGQFYIAETYNSNGFYKNWVESKKKGKIVALYNFHTAGRKFFVKWGKILAKLKRKQSYVFKPCRGKGENYTGKRGLAAWINKCSVDPYLPDYRGELM